MKFYRLLCILICLEAFSISLKAQNIQYDIKIQPVSQDNNGEENAGNDHLKNYQAEVRIQIPETLVLPSDTLWFHWPLIAMSQKYSVYSTAQVRSGEYEFYFRRPENRAQIVSCDISYDNTKTVMNQTKLENEYIPVTGIKNKEIIFTFSFILPEWSFGSGVYKDKIVSFDFFYPRLAYYDGRWHKNPFKGVVRRPYFGQNITLQMPVKENFHVISSGKLTDSLSNHIVLEATGTPNLSVFYVRKDVHVSQNTVFSDKNHISYTLVHEPSHDIPPTFSADSIQNILNEVMTRAGKYPLEHLIIMVLKKEKEETYDYGIAFIPEYSEVHPASLIISTSIDENWTHDDSRDFWMQRGLFSYLYYKLYETEDKNSGVILMKSNIEAQHLFTDFFSRNIGNQHCLLKSYFLPLTIFEYMEAMIGDSILKHVLDHMAEHRITFNLENLKKQLSLHTDVSLEFLDTYMHNKSPLSPGIKEVETTSDGLYVQLRCRENMGLPIPLTIYRTDNSVETQIVEPFIGEKIISLQNEKPSEVKYVVLDKNLVLPDTRRSDNFWISEEGDFKQDFYKNNPRYKGDYRLFFPLLTYNDNNKLMLGILYANHNESNYKKTGFTLFPSFSYRENRIVGEAGIYHDVYIRHRYFDRIRFRSDVKSYYFNHNKDLDYVQQYVRVDPGFELRFRKAAERGVESGISVKSYIIREDEPDFTSEGKFSGLNSANSYIFRAVYYHTKNKRLSSTHHEWALEQQSYNDENYLKMSATWMKRWMYKNKRNIKVRFFGSGFILNSQRKSPSYQNALTRGSIALIHQGFNDYTYDEYFFSRQNQNQLQRHQVSMYQGGGFKTAVGSAHDIGMSNHFALASNIVMDLPFGQGYLPVQLYFDGGVYSTYEGSRFKNNLIYNGGISVHLSELVYIHIPLIYSENLGNIHREVHKTFWNRISFSFNLNRIT
jgi:hypothetical protein